MNIYAGESRLGSCELTQESGDLARLRLSLLLTLLILLINGAQSCFWAPTSAIVGGLFRQT